LTEDLGHPAPGAAFTCRDYADARCKAFGQQDELIIGLFKKLPEPASEWNEADRLKWLQTAANIFDLVYTGDSGGFCIVPARADRCPRPHDHE